MNAVLLLGHGGYDQLVWRDDVPIPQPGADEVLIRVAAAGLNNTDINMRVGWYSKAAQSGGASRAAGGADEFAAADALADAGWTGGSVAFPLIQGADVCGRVVATGVSVDAGRLGQRVLVDPVLRRAGREPGYLGSDCHGAFADYVKVPAANAHPIDCALTDEQLASFPCSYSAAENMLTRAAVRDAETVLITGASGGVGSAAVQLARRRGAGVAALAADSKAAEVLALGALRVLPRDADLVAALGPESVDVVIDVVGGGQFPEFLQVLKRGGRYAVAGAIAGPLVTLDLRTLYLKDLSLIGCTVTEPRVFADLVRYIEAGEIRPLVARTYPLTAIAEAQRDFLAKRHTGKLVLLP